MLVKCFSNLQTIYISCLRNANCYGRTLVSSSVSYINLLQAFPISQSELRVDGIPDLFARIGV